MTTASAAFDPDLESLPKPRRPWRRSTLVVMVVTAVASTLLIVSLAGLARYAFEGGAPRELGSLTDVQLTSDLGNRWVKARGYLGPTALEYRRPLVSDRFRLSPIEGVPNLWVEVRVPRDLAIEHFVPPTSFVGRLVPLEAAGLPYEGVEAAIEEVQGEAVLERTWVLIDGEAPSAARWVVAVIALLAVFVAFCVGGVVHLLRPVNDS